MRFPYLRTHAVEDDTRHDFHPRLVECLYAEAQLQLQLSIQTLYPNSFKFLAIISSNFLDWTVCSANCTTNRFISSSNCSSFSCFSSAPTNLRGVRIHPFCRICSNKTDLQ